MVWLRDEDDTDLETVLRGAGLKPTREPGIPVMALYQRLAEIPLPANLTLSRVTETKDATD